jgi:hypothetical protein
MKTQHVGASTVIDAPAQWIYKILANYRDGHPRILPARYFSSLEVERGGIGAGTVIRFEMRVPGMTRTFHADVTEPEPGRVLVESNWVEINGEQQAQVTISTTLSVANWLEGLLTTRFLRRVYDQELKQIAALAAQRPPDSNAESVRA